MTYLVASYVEPSTEKASQARGMNRTRSSNSTTHSCRTGQLPKLLWLVIISTPLLLELPQRSGRQFVNTLPSLSPSRQPPSGQASIACWAELQYIASGHHMSKSSWTSPTAITTTPAGDSLPVPGKRLAGATVARAYLSTHVSHVYLSLVCTRIN